MSDTFVDCPVFTEPWEGYYFGTGSQGTGYYWDYVAEGTTKPKPGEYRNSGKKDDLLAPGLSNDAAASRYLDNIH